MEQGIKADAHPALFDDFLGEVQALDDFRAQYSRRYQFEGLGREDQDVQRLIEAMAFYSARSRRSAERALEEFKRRALERLFPHLLTPMPAMALFYPELGANSQETQVLPQGAAVTAHVNQEVDMSADKLYRTRSALTIVPLHIVAGSVRLGRKVPEKSAVQVVGAPRAKDRWNLSIQVAASRTGPGKKRFYADIEHPLDTFRLHLNPGGDVLLALRTFDALKESFLKVRCTFWSEKVELHSLSLKNVSFGHQRAPDRPTTENPLEAVRRFIHFPHSELFVDFDLSGAPDEWDLLELEVELDEQWPGSLGVADSSFLLNVVTVENVQTTFAEAIDVDGTQLKFPIMHPEPETGMAVQSISGVYLGDPKTSGGKNPLFPNLLVGGGYSVDVVGSPREAWLEVDADLDAVLEPKRIYVEAQWYQPAEPVPVARIGTDSHELGDLRWCFAHPVAGAQLSSVQQDVAALQQLLDLHSVTKFELADIRHLLNVLGASESEVFSRVPRYISALNVDLVPDAASQQGGLKLYEVVLRKVPLALIPTVRLLFAILPETLALWMGDTDVSVTLIWQEQPEIHSKTYTWRATDES